MTLSYIHGGLKPFSIKIRVDGKLAGRIRRLGQAYYFAPKRGNAGPVLESVDAVKAYLEERFA